jgi:hypothetical protein
MERVFKQESIQPRALLVCLFLDFALSTVVFGPIIIITFRGSWQVHNSFGS